MNKKMILDLTIKIVQKYYQNDPQPFLDHVDENVLWYGPAKGQFLSGRQALLEAWAGERHSLTFSLGNIRLDHVSDSNSHCDVMASYPVTTHYPDGESITMDQISHFSWIERKMKDSKENQPRILVMHVSDLYQKHNADNIYPVHFKEIYKGYMPISNLGKHLFFQGIDSFDLYLLSDTILWVDSIQNGRHSIIHTADTDYRVRESIAYLEKEHSDLLMRCHICHLINPKHIVCIKRFTVTLSNGKTLPIPEKKYTAFRKAVHEKLPDINNSSVE